MGQRHGCPWRLHPGMIGLMTVGVYGLGRFGAFWAGELARRYEVIGYSRNPERESPDTVRRVSEDKVLESDVLFLCVAISAMEEVLTRIAPAIRSGALVMDTCSVKTYPITLMERLLPDRVHIIGTHPMFGPDSGRDGLAGLPLVFSPVRAPKQVTHRWRENFESLGLMVIPLSPSEHDREAAFTQGITHFVGRVLKILDLRTSTIGTLGYRRLLGIMEQTCNDPYQLFLDLQKYNPYTREMRERLQSALANTIDALEEYPSSDLLDTDHS